MVTREVVSLLHPGYNESETLDLSTYGFLYGTFPSAPGVFVFAMQYSTNEDLVCAQFWVFYPFNFISVEKYDNVKWY